LRDVARGSFESTHPMQPGSEFPLHARVLLGSREFKCSAYFLNDPLIVPRKPCCFGTHDGEGSDTLQFTQRARQLERLLKRCLGARVTAPHSQMREYRQ